jgi:hypothetical protein
LRISGRWAAAAATLALAASAWTSKASAEPLTLLYAEPLGRLAFDGSPARAAEAGSGLQRAGGGRLQFEAYGQIFDLELSENDALLVGLNRAARGTARAGSRYLKGRLSGLPGSWARLTADAAGVSGVVWDGQQMYVLERAARVAKLSVVPLQPAGGTFVYRASDALLHGGIGACGSEGGRPDGSLADETRAILGEFTAGRAKPGASREIAVVLVADTEFSSLHGSQTEQAMLERMNIVDGLYSEQLGLQIVAAGLSVYRGEPDPFSETDDQRLLAELLDWAGGQAGSQSAAATYLFTGREVCRTGVLGCSVNGRSSATLCGASAAALGEPLGEVYLDALLLAHELGHNLGAIHDGIELCASTPSGGFLMSQYTEKRSETLSQCSLAQMSATLATASCALPIAGAPPPPPPPPLPLPSPGPGSTNSGGGGAVGPLLLLVALLGRRRARGSA